MCLWLRWFSTKPGKSVPASTPGQDNPKPQPDEDDDTHSKICSVYNALSLQETGYIDEATLRGALDDIFQREGQLDFGIMVGCKQCHY